MRWNIKATTRARAGFSSEFTADRAGTFPFQCSVFRGLGHKKMKGQLIVE